MKRHMNIEEQVRCELTKRRARWYTNGTVTYGNKEISKEQRKRVCDSWNQNKDRIETEIRDQLTRTKFNMHL
jgi:hypothetical protein